MPRTHDVGPFYWHTIKSPGRPNAWVGRSWTDETEAPYRHGAGWAVRIGARRILILGRWHAVERTEEEALLAALGASALLVDTAELRGWDSGLPPEVGLDGGDEGGEADRRPGDPRAGALGGTVPLSDRA